MAESEETLSLEMQGLPYNLEAEQSVLGAILIDSNVVARVLDFVRPECFYRKQHQDIFSIMLRMFLAGSILDYVTVLEACCEEQVFESNEAAKLYLARLAQLVPSVANVEAYAKIVQEKFYIRSLILAAKEIESHCMEGGEGAGALLDWAEQKIFEIRQGKDANGLKRIDEIFLATYDHLQKISGPDKGDYLGTSSGFTQLDQVLSGLNKSDLILVAGRPGMGKTTFAINIAQHMATRDNKKVVIFSLEMSGEQLVTRMLSSEASISSMRPAHRHPHQREWCSLATAGDVLVKSPIYIDDTAGITPAEMKAKLRRIKNLGGVFIDYLQLMSNGGRRSENRVQEVSDITRNLKIMARELNVPVVLCSQLSRGPESRQDHRPMLSDLRESGSIEQDADIVLFLYREGYYDKQSPEQNIAECIIAKNRHGETGTVKISWNGQYSRFGNLELYAQEP